MRKKVVLLVGGGLALIGVIIVTAMLLSRDKHTGGDVCQDFITLIQRRDAQRSYELYTPAAQQRTPFSDWQKNVKYLARYYGDTAPVLRSVTASVNPDTPIAEQKMTYQLKSAMGSFTAICFVSQDSNKINWYSSQLSDL